MPESEEAMAVEEEGTGDCTGVPKPTVVASTGVVNVMVVVVRVNVVSRLRLNSIGTTMGRFDAV